jgi:hypothetical protein
LLVIELTTPMNKHSSRDHEHLGDQINADRESQLGEVRELQELPGGDVPGGGCEWEQETAPPPQEPLRIFPARIGPLVRLSAG